MTLADRLPWLRRDGAPLAISLVLHVVLLLLVAPWLYMRTIPNQPIEVEVMLEPDASEPPPTRSDIASLLRAPESLPRMRLKSLFEPMTPRPALSTPIEPEIEQRFAQPMASMVPGEQPGADKSGSAGPDTPTPREAAGL